MSPLLMRSTLLPISDLRGQGTGAEKKPPPPPRWGPSTVGYGAHAIFFGPQFGFFHGADEWRATLSGVRAAVARADACLGRTTPLFFRSPAFNFDPVNSPQQQAQFGQLMRPLVEEQ
eukprot:scaffold15058_cov67-Isochrysis_galbana.AAC.1